MRNIGLENDSPNGESISWNVMELWRILESFHRLAFAVALDNLLLHMQQKVILSHGRLNVRSCRLASRSTSTRQESQRDSVPKPRVARNELPWVTVRQTAPTATRLRPIGSRPRLTPATTPLALIPFPDARPR